MKDLKEAYADACDLVEDFLDLEELESYLYDDLALDLVHWSQFENALQEASDSEHQNEELIAMDRDIAHEVVGRIDKKYQLIEIDRVKYMQKRIKELEVYIASIPLGGKRYDTQPPIINNPDNVVKS